MRPRKAPIQAAVIGASAGAIEALSVILPKLATGLSIAVIVVVHLPPDQKSLIVELFLRKCKVNVKEAEDKEPIECGTVYFAPPDYHVLIEPDRRLSLSGEEPVLFSRPSIDVLFESAADTYGEHLMGIVLTGASPDGAQGLRCVYDSGGLAVVQQPETAYASAMPRAALDACPDAWSLDLEGISALLGQAGLTEQM